METISSINIDGNEFKLVHSSDNTVVVFYNGHEYHALSDLIVAANLRGNVVNLAQVICFAHGEDDYRYIDDISRFKSEYNNKVQSEKSITDPTTQKTSTWEVYDVSELSPPSEVDGNLIFYAEKKATGVPYRVKWDEVHGKCSFKLLKSA